MTGVGFGGGGMIVGAGGLRISEVGSIAGVGVPVGGDGLTNEDISASKRSISDSIASHFWSFILWYVIYLQTINSAS